MQNRPKRRMMVLLFILLQSLCVPLWNIKDINVYFICFVNYTDTAFLQKSILNDALKAKLKKICINKEDVFTAAYRNASFFIGQAGLPFCFNPCMIQVRF